MLFLSVSNVDAIESRALMVYRMIGNETSNSPEAGDKTNKEVKVFFPVLVNDVPAALLSFWAMLRLSFVESRAFV